MMNLLGKLLKDGSSGRATGESVFYFTPEWLIASVAIISPQLGRCS
jgi:hypothetical protein